MAKIYRYEPIPGEEDGCTHLSIYPPGTWFSHDDFVVFVGGGGVGSAPTLDIAKKMLKKSAVAYCQREIDKAQRKLDHYMKQRDRILDDGIGRATREEQ